MPDSAKRPRKLLAVLFLSSQRPNDTRLQEVSLPQIPFAPVAFASSLGPFQRGEPDHLDTLCRIRQVKPPGRQCVAFAADFPVRHSRQTPSALNVPDLKDDEAGAINLSLAISQFQFSWMARSRELPQVIGVAAAIHPFCSLFKRSCTFLALHPLALR